MIPWMITLSIMINIVILVNIDTIVIGSEYRLYIMTFPVSTMIIQRVTSSWLKNFMTRRIG